MADTKIQLPPDSTGASVDTVDVTTGAGVVKREVVSLGDPTTGANRAVVTAAGKLLVTPDSVALPANQSVNAAQLAGTATSVNSGTKDAGTLRVVLATDQPALTNKLLVTPDSVALPANQSVNAAQFGGTNIVTGAGASGAGIPRVTVSNDSSLAANQSVNLNQVGAAAITEGQKTMAASIPVVVASDQSSLPVTVISSPLCVVIAPAANTGGTITLPAVAGQFHYITAIEITRNATAALAGTATLVITTTNLPGGGTWFRVGNLMVAGGTQKDVNQQFASPIKSSVANTNTTIVFPVPGAAVLWTATVWYYAAA